MQLCSILMPLLIPFVDNSNLKCYKINISCLEKFTRNSLTIKRNRSPVSFLQNYFKYTISFLARKITILLNNKIIQLDLENKVDDILTKSLLRFDDKLTNALYVK